MLTSLKIEVEKSAAPNSNQTHDLSVTRHVLYLCATTSYLIYLNLGLTPKKVFDVPDRVSGRPNLLKVDDVLLLEAHYLRPQIFGRLCVRSKILNQKKDQTIRFRRKVKGEGQPA